MKPGIYYDVPIETYHAPGAAGISKSGLDTLARSPAHFYARHIDPARPPEPAHAGQLEGNLAHCAVLEPAQFHRRYVTVPKDAPRRPSPAQWGAKNPSDESKAAMAWWSEWNERTKGATDVTAAQYDTAMRQAESIHALPELRDILALGRPEVSAYWKDQKTGVLCRCRPDWVHPQSDRYAILLDVKTCGDASAHEFVRQIARKRYHVQDAFYSDGFAAASGLTVGAFIFVAVESEYPYAAATYQLGEDSRGEGFNEYRRLLDLYAECKKTDTWPGYADTVTVVDLPPYAMTPQELDLSYVE